MSEHEFITLRGCRIDDQFPICDSPHPFLAAPSPPQGKVIPLLSSLSSLMSMDSASAHPSEEVNAAEVLAECRKLAMEVKVPPAVREELAKAMKTAGEGRGEPRARR